MAKIKLTKKQQENLLNRIWQDYHFGLAEREKHEPDWEHWRQQYNSEWTELTRQQDDEDLDQWVYVPKTYMVTHRIECSLQQHFFPRQSSRLGKVEAPTMGGESGMWIELADLVLHAKLDLEGRPERSLPSAFNAGLIEGNGWVKVSWDKASKRAGGRSINVSRPRIEYVTNEDVVHDPYAKADRQIGWVVHLLWLSEEELWQRQVDGIYENVEEVVTGADEAGQDPWREQVAGPGNIERTLFCLMEFWGPQQLKTQEELDALHRQGNHAVMRDIAATVYKNKVVLRCEDNGFAKLFDNPDPFDKVPFFKCSPLPERGSTYGDSLVKRVRPLQREINTLRNQRRMAVESELNRKIFYDQNRLTELERLYQARYQGFVPTNGPPRDVVYDFAPITSTAGLENEESIMDGDLRDITGVTHYHMGSTQAGMQKTATGVSIVTSEGNVKLDTIIENVAQSLVTPLVEFVMECCIEWVSPAEINAMLGRQGEEPPKLRDVLSRDYHTQVQAGASATSKQMQIQQMESALAYTAQLANAMPEKAGATVDLLMPKLLTLMGQPDAAAQWGQAVQAQPEQTPPSGYGQEAPPNPGEERRRSRQIRPRTPQEVAG